MPKSSRRRAGPENLLPTGKLDVSGLWSHTHGDWVSDLTARQGQADTLSISLFKEVALTKPCQTGIQAQYGQVF